MRPGFNIVVQGGEKTLVSLRTEAEAVNRETIKALHFSAQLVRKNVVALATGRLVNVRSGAYRASVQTNVDEQHLTATVGTGIKYARMVEDGTELMPGGRMVPKTKKYLAIPISGSPAATKAGVTKSPRDFPDTFLAKTPGGPPIIFLRGGTHLVPLFVLKKSVRIKGRHVFRTAFEMSKPEIGARFSVGIRMAVNK